MKPTIIHLFVTLLTLLTLLTPSGQAFARADDQPLPAEWLARWRNPPPVDRPLQIVHGIDPARAMPEGIQQMLHEQDSDRVAPEGMDYYKNRGLGGVVCNVAFEKYMRSEKNFKTLVAGVEACQRLGMVVWLYDEEGYPSGAAGGLVLKENAAFEATALAWDRSRDDPFVLRPSYEHTHASNNYYAARRYANLIDDRAGRCFIDKTHQAYWKRLEPHFGRTIQAMFTDEPSLMAVNLGQIPEQVRKTVPVADPVDPAIQALPSVPWVYDLPVRYQERFGEDLMPQRASLFAGTSAEDRKVRRQFWALIADLIAERYFGAIGRWCSLHRVASSGHSLWEEQVLHHVPLEGNGLKVLAQMDIPGLDMLSSDPRVVGYSGWLTAAMPASAALLTGRRRVMTEVSDFSQKMAKQGPAGLTEMQATAAWQATWGVTDFTLYYGISDRSADDYRAYCEYVGRLNAVLKPARPDPEVLLYYPIYDLWAEYLPVAEPLVLHSQSARAQQIVASFMQLGQMLQRNQVPFTLIDHEHLAAAKVLPNGKLAVKDQRGKALILPQGVQLPSSVSRVVEEFRQAGGKILAEPAAAEKQSAKSLVAQLQPALQISPPSEDVALGQFVRDGRRIVLVLNVAEETYGGHLAGEVAGSWQVMDPHSGSIRPAEIDANGHIRLSLHAREAVLLVHTQPVVR